MEMDLEKQELDLLLMNQLDKDGYIILKNFFNKDKIQNLLESTKDVFKIQFNKLNYQGYNNEEGFKSCIIRLFNEHFDIFQNCGKLIQSGLIELYKLAYSDLILDTLKKLDIKKPLVCTRPVLFFNHKNLAKQTQYYKTPLHQDYPTILSSLDSVVVWVPLINVNKSNGSIIIYPGSHKLGELKSLKTDTGFAEVNIPDKFVPLQPELEIGDIAIFSTFLVHKSGEIKNDQIRWSCHFRYTNLLDNDFIDRGFPSPYIYKSTSV